MKRQIHGYLYSSRVVTVVVEMYTHEIRLSVGLKLPLIFHFHDINYSVFLALSSFVIQPSKKRIY